MRYYFAYGQNTDYEMMGYRTSDAQLIGLAYIKGWKLQFNGHATISKVGFDEKCFGVMWRISEKDERDLDKFEGTPTLYRKVYLPVFVPGIKVGGSNLSGYADFKHVLVYQMVSDITKPPYSYDLETVMAFRKRYGLDCSDLFNYQKE